MVYTLQVYYMCVCVAARMYRERGYRLAHLHIAQIDLIRANYNIILYIRRTHIILCCVLYAYHVVVGLRRYILIRGDGPRLCFR